MKAIDIFTFKNFFFSSGLISGVYLGIYLRKKGLSKNLTLLYHISKEDDYSTTRDLSRPHATIDDLYNHFNTGMFTDKKKFEKFKDITYSHMFKQDEMDELIGRDPLRQLRDPKYKDVQSKFNAFDYQKYYKKSKKDKIDYIKQSRLEND